jgi:hypothetical protein
MFSYMLSLTEILADVLESMYTMQVEKELQWAGSQGLDLILQKAKPLQIRLKEWFTELPECLRMDSTQALKLSSAGSLRLDYLATEATIHRRILIAASQTDPHPRLWEILQSAASTRLISAIEFVQGLKPQELMSFWYAATRTNLSLIGTLGIILCAAAKSPEDRSFFIEKLKAYRWALRVNYVAGAQFMKPALSLLEANMKVLGLSKPQYVEQNEDILEEVNEVDGTIAQGAYRSSSYQAVEEWTMSSSIALPDDSFFAAQFLSEL